jgi:hypothetical protein
MIARLNQFTAASTVHSGAGWLRVLMTRISNRRASPQAPYPPQRLLFNHIPDCRQEATQFTTISDKVIGRRVVPNPLQFFIVVPAA